MVCDNVLVNVIDCKFAIDFFTGILVDAIETPCRFTGLQIKCSHSDYS